MSNDVLTQVIRGQSVQTWCSWIFKLIIKASAMRPNTIQVCHTCTLHLFWLHGSLKVMEKNVFFMFVVVLIDHKKLHFLLLLLLFCLFNFYINAKDFFWCLLLFLLLHSHPLSFISTPHPPPLLTIMPLLSIVPSLPSPAMHLGIPQDMESDPDDEVNKFFIITWNCFFYVDVFFSFFFCLVCKCWKKYVRCKYFVSVQNPS